MKYYGPRHIPSLKKLNEWFGKQFAHEYGDEATLKLKALRMLLEGWRDRGISSNAMLESANEYLRGHGVEYIESDNGRARAYYVNMGDTYNGTLLLDVRRHRVWVTTWGDWLEAEERAGNRFS